MSTVHPAIPSIVLQMFITVNESSLVRKGLVHFVDNLLDAFGEAFIERTSRSGKVAAAGFVILGDVLKITRAAVERDVYFFHGVVLKHCDASHKAHELFRISIFYKMRCNDALSGEISADISNMLFEVTFVCHCFENVLG